MSAIVSAQTAFPKSCYSQKFLTSELLKAWTGAEFDQELLEKFHVSVGVEKRHLAMPLEAYKKLGDFTERNDAYIENALALGEECIRKLLEKTAVEPSEVNELIFTTVTGLSVPSIDAKLMNKIPFSKNMKRVPLFGLGCVAGVAGLSRAADYLKGHPDDVLVLLSVELCSLTIQRDDLSIANMVAAGLFGDGAAAVLLAGRNHELAKGSKCPRIIDYQSVFFENTEGTMGWKIGSFGFGIVLSSLVPKIAQELLPSHVHSFLQKNGLKVGDIKHFVSHPGGPRVIDALEDGLGLCRGRLDNSRESLKNIGNLSSASVLTILEATLNDGASPGEYGLIMAMGPAFCAEVMLVQW